MPAVRSLEVDLEEGMPSAEHTRSTEPHDRADALKNSSTPHPKESNNQPWFETQLECAICLSEFIKGDKVRVLPCLHIFHLSEVDEWLIQRKKLARIKINVVSAFRLISSLLVPYMQSWRDAASSTRTTGESLVITVLFPRWPPTSAKCDWTNAVVASKWCKRLLMASHDDKNLVLFSLYLVVSYLTFSLTFSFVTYLSLINIRLCLGWNYLNKIVGWAVILVALTDVVTVGLQI